MMTAAICILVYLALCGFVYAPFIVSGRESRWEAAASRGTGELLRFRPKAGNEDFHIHPAGGA